MQSILHWIPFCPHDLFVAPLFWIMHEMSLTLVLANKAYSSWSFRPFILMRHFDIPFAEIVIPLGEESTRAEIPRHAPSGKCPALHDGDLVVWDSLAIIESRRALSRSTDLAAGEEGARDGALACRRNAFRLHGATRQSADEHAPPGQAA
jgi:glutathione S-transferase